jgi:hypothetical protein
MRRRPRHRRQLIFNVVTWANVVLIVGPTIAPASVTDMGAVYDAVQSDVLQIVPMITVEPPAITMIVRVDATANSVGIFALAIDARLGVLEITADVFAPVMYAVVDVMDLFAGRYVTVPNALETASGHIVGIDVPVPTALVGVMEHTAGLNATVSNALKTVSDPGVG